MCARLLREINHLPASIGSPDGLESGFSQYLPVDQGPYPEAIVVL
jgi:hypothetical protein